MRYCLVCYEWQYNFPWRVENSLRKRNIFPLLVWIKDSAHRVLRRLETQLPIVWWTAVIHHGCDSPRVRYGMEFDAFGILVPIDVSCLLKMPHFPARNRDSGSVQSHSPDSYHKWSFASPLFLRQQRWELICSKQFTHVIYSVIYLIWNCLVFWYYKSMMVCLITTWKACSKQLSPGDGVEAPILSRFKPSDRA